MDTQEERGRRMAKYPEHYAMLVEAALKQARREHGEDYSSPHEFYAILKEEAEEASESLAGARTLLQDGIWRKVRRNEWISDDVEDFRRAMLWTASECVQCMAVCEKWLAGDDRRENDNKED